MNDKNRDWVDEAFEELAMVYPAVLEKLSPTDIYRIKEQVRSHIPPQPPIAENARDWKSNYIRALNAWAETNGKLSFTPEIAETLLRQFAPAQPPIAEDVMELAYDLMDKHDVVVIQHRIQSFLTAHSAEQNKETIRVLEQIQNNSCDGCEDKGCLHCGEVNELSTTHLQKLKGQTK